MLALVMFIYSIYANLLAASIIIPIDDINDITGEFDMTAGFSLQLMMAAGAISIPALFVSCATLYYFVKAENGSNEGLQASLTPQQSKNENGENNQL
jgi:hypothetical protein